MWLAPCDLRWLTSDAAARWLGDPELAALDELTGAKRLRRELSAGRARLVSVQHALRARAKAKFDGAERMFFTPLGLEQATDQAVARHKAARFPEGRPLADLCAGVG